MKLEILNKELEGFKGEAWHFRIKWNPFKKWSYYIASAVVVIHDGPEVLIFPSNQDEEVLSWLESYGERDTLDHQEVIDNFAKHGEYKW